jgi:SNF2 family DNA or RNA helicase
MAARSQPRPLHAREGAWRDAQGGRVSRNPYRLSFARRGWAEIRWHHEFQPDDHVQNMLRVAARVAGVRWAPGFSFVSIPETAWSVVEAEHAISATVGMELFNRKQPHTPLLGGVYWNATESEESLYPWQRTAAQQACATGRMLLCDSMGLGKTRTAIEAAETFATRSTAPRFIVAPGFTRDVWLRELLATNTIADESEFCALYTREHNDASWRDDARWYFIHYDIVHAWASKIASSKRGKPITCIVDEIHWCKNPKTQRSKGVLNVAAGAQFRMGLTGTPMENRVGELHQPLSIVTGPRTWGSQLDFRRRYAGAVHNGYGYQDRYPTYVDELRHRIAPYYLRRTVEDTGAALPALRREQLKVAMDTAALEAHHAVGSTREIAELVDAVLESRAGSETLVLLNRLRKITSDAKIPHTVEYVRNLLDQGESVVVFCWQRQTARKIVGGIGRSKLNRAGNDDLRDYLAIDGGWDQADRDRAVESFQKYGGLIAATYGVLREGVTLTRARAVVLHDLDFVPSALLQAEARVHRLGQQRGCIATWVLAEDSIDIIMARCLLLKAEHIEKTLGITASAAAMDELGLDGIAGYEDTQEWARDMLERWFGC